MKKSEIRHDLQQVIERLSAISKSQNIASHKDELLATVGKLKTIKDKTSLGMVSSITRRQTDNKNTKECRFCGK